jgi:hypothetical protein
MKSFYYLLAGLGAMAFFIFILAVPDGTDYAVHITDTIGSVDNP